MDGARVSDQERSRETVASQGERGLDTAPRLSAPVGGVGSARQGCERVEPERDCAIVGLCARPLDEGAKTKRLIGAVGPKIQFESRPFVETHAVERPVEGGGVEASKTKTVGADRAGGHDLQAVRSIGEVVERLGVGLVGAGMIESSDDPPRTARPDRPGAFRWRIDGLDPDAIRRLGHKGFEARALERGLSGLAPIGFGSGGKEICDCAQSRLSLDKLGKPGNRRRDFAYDLIACGFARIAENFLSDRLDLLHVETQAQQFRAQRH